MPKKTLAARAAYWSARHRKTAIFGWLAFVVIAFVLGGAIGTKTHRRRGLRQRPVAHRRPPDRRRRLPEEVRRAGARPGPRAMARRPTPASRRRQGRRPSGSSARTYVTEVESPLAKGNDGQISKDGRSALVTFTIPGDSDVAEDRVDAPSDATVAAAQKAHPDLRIEQFGDATADKALSASPRQRLPARRDAVAPDHADHPDRRVRRARRRRRAAAARPDRRGRPRSACSGRSARSSRWTSRSTR